MSKGDSPRPIPNPEKFRENWDLIFPRKQHEYYGYDHVFAEAIRARGQE